MTSTRPGLPTTPPRFVSSYTALAQTVRRSDLLERRYGYYWTQMAVWCAALAGLIVAMVWLGDSWWQLIVAGLLGAVLTQFGFLGHDAAHRQVFRSPVWNEWAARILSGAFSGLSYGWWRHKHSLHHSAPNQVDRDPDIAPGVIAFTAEAAAGRTGIVGWCSAHQGWLFVPLLTLEGLNLHVAGIRALLTSSLPHRRLETTVVLARMTGLIVVLVVVMPPAKAALFLAVQLAVFGVLLGGSFAPNHTGMPIVPRNTRINFLDRQVLMSRNVRGNWFLDVAMGGLNYQVEHHLFPSMPRPNLRRVRGIVRAHCRAEGVPYTELGLFESYAVVIGYLNNVGLRARGPFDCPLASRLRD